MKVYSLPTEVPVAPIDYKDFSLAKMQADEDEHAARLKVHLIAQGYTGKNTGRIYRIPHADGHASYMYAHASRGSCLIHLPYCDAWHSPYVEKMTQKEVIASMDQSDKRVALFGSRIVGKA